MRGRVNPLGRGGAAAACVLTLALLAAGLNGTPPVRAQDPGGVVKVATSYPAWSNGVVVLAFPHAHPTFSLTSVANSSISANQSLSGLAEITPSGAMAAFASFSGTPAPWSFAATSTANATNISLRTIVAAWTSSGEWESGDDVVNGSRLVGYANVTLTFHFNGSGGGSPLSLAYDLQVAGWPWVRANDALGLEVRSNATSTAGYWMPNGTAGLTEFAPVTHTPLAEFSWAGAVLAQYAGGRSANLSIGSYQNISSGGGDYLVRLEFGSQSPSSGGYADLSYDPTLTLIVPALAPLVPTSVPAWLLTPLALEVLGVGAAVSVVLAAVARRRRSPPDSGL